MERLRHVLSRCNFTWELILVGNYIEGRDDETPEVVGELARRWPNVAAIVRPKEGMMGWDMRMGLNAARGERDDGLYRRLISYVYNGLFKLLFGLQIHDVNSKPKIIRRDKYELLDLKSDDWFADAEIMICARAAGLSIGEIPVHFALNENRGSFVKPKAIFEFMSNLIRYRFGVRKKPLESEKPLNHLDTQPNSRHLPSQTSRG